MPSAQRELKPWGSDGAGMSNGRQANPNSNGNGGGGGNAHNRDMDTFGPASGPPKAWDQFEANARLFGTTSTYQEELYTTKLDKSGADFKKREKEADRLAAEIMGVRFRTPGSAPD